MAVTTTVGHMGPFDFRQCPIWAIPQIAEIAFQLRGKAVEFHNNGNGTGTVIVVIPGEVAYSFNVCSENMNLDYSIYAYGFRVI